MGYFKMTIRKDGKREDWIVKVAASKLRACCDERMDYHSTREQFWVAEAEGADKELRAGGMAIREHRHSGGKETTVKFDQDKADRLGHCQRKQREHRESHARFGAYKAMFSLLGEADVEMNADDVLYFNVEGADVAKDEEQEGNDE